MRALLPRILLFLILAYGAGLALFIALLPHTPAITPEADGIVVLTGGDVRLDAAVALLEKNAGRRLLISGANPATSKDQLAARLHAGRRFACCADVGHAALDTRGNASEAAAWMAAHDYASLILVTARYHMPRSLSEFSAAMPDVKLVPYAVEPESVSSWWKPATLNLLHLEYAKFLASLITTRIDPPRAGDDGSRIAHY